MQPWRERWGVEDWREYLAAKEAESEAAAIRQCTHTGRPLGSEQFVTALEKDMSRPLAPQKGGRRAKAAADAKQEMFAFVE